MLGVLGSVSRAFRHSDGVVIEGGLEASIQVWSRWKTLKADLGVLVRRLLSICIPSNLRDKQVAYKPSKEIIVIGAIVPAWWYRIHGSVLRTVRGHGLHNISSVWTSWIIYNENMIPTSANLRGTVWYGHMVS